MTDPVSASNVSAMIDQAVSDLGKTSGIVRDIFQKLDQFKREVDEEIRKAILRKVTEAVQQLQGVANRLGNVTDNLTEIQDKISDIRISGEVGKDDDAALRQVQRLIEDLKHRIQAF